MKKMKKMITIIIMVLGMQLIAASEPYHPIDEMEPFECYAEYGMNCEEAEQYEEDQYQQSKDEDSYEDEDDGTDEDNTEEDDG